MSVHEPLRARPRQTPAPKSPAPGAPIAAPPTGAPASVAETNGAELAALVGRSSVAPTLSPPAPRVRRARERAVVRRRVAGGKVGDKVHDEQGASYTVKAVTKDEFGDTLYTLGPDGGGEEFQVYGDVRTFELSAVSLADVMGSAPTLKDGFAAALARVPGLTIDTLKPYLERAKQPERDAVWKDRALMDEAKRILSRDDYLALLPALAVFVPPSTGTLPLQQGGFTSHFSPAQVDQLIGQHLSQYVKVAVQQGRKAEGELSVVDDADWELAFRRQWPGFQPGMADAFVDVNQPKRHIWIHKDRGDPGTAIHEGMHKYASDEIRNRHVAAYRSGRVPISTLDEGLTEYFTRKVTAAIGLPRLNYYASETQLAVVLVRAAGEAVAAKAYFDGELDAMISAYLSATKRTKAHWDHLARAAEEERWSDVASILKTGAEK